jgi:ribosomal protein S12 methylthiotransferase
MAPQRPRPIGRVALISLGCAKNLADSERLVGDLEGAGFALADGIEDADLALVNTCGFIDPAKEESVDAILEVAQRKDYGRLRGVIVAGCLVERYAAQLAKDIPEVDRWMPFSDYGKVVTAARELLGLPAVRETAATRRVLLTPTGYAYLKISEGCDQKCTFCSIPSFRGRLVSRTIEDLVADARRIAAQGVGEVNLVSQDTTAYGRDVYGKPRLAELLRALTEVEGPRWWRLLYLYPSVLRDDVLDEVARNPRVAKYLDLPLQHLSSGMLRAMRRGIDGDRQRALLERIRERIPGVAVRTTLIAGFPGETEADHAVSLEGVRAGLFDRLGVFTYCREEGTPSHDMPDQVPAEVANRRRDELMAAQQEVHFARAAAQVGRGLDVLVERVEPFGKRAVGRSEHDAPDVDGKVRIEPAPRGTKPGEFVRVEVVAADGYDLVARPAGAAATAAGATAGAGTS